MDSLDQALAIFLLVRVCRGHRLLHRYLLMLGITVGMVSLVVSACGSPTPPPNPSLPPQSGGSAHANVSSSGAYQTGIPITVPPYHGLEPHLGLTYSSQRGSGWLGTGWNLSGFSSVLRASPSRGVPSYDAQDVFYLDGMQLIICQDGMQSPSCLYPFANNWAYTTHIESYRRIAFNPAWTPGGRWFVWEKTGTKVTYEPRNLLASTHVRAWDIVSSEDTLGNKVSYRYWRDTAAPGLGETYPDSVIYNGTIIKFYWELRPDPITYAAGSGYSQVAVRYLLKTIDVTISGARARAYALHYAQHEGSLRSVLSRVQEYGKDAFLDGAGTVRSGTALPPVELAYKKPGGPKAWAGTQFDSKAVAPGDTGGSPSPIFSGATQEIERSDYSSFHTGDFDGDGRSDELLQTLTGLRGFAEKKPVIHFVTQFASNRKVQTSADLLNRHPELFTKGSTLPDGRSSLLRSWVGDVNGDGRDDLILMSWAAVDPNNPDYDLKLQLNTAISEGDGRFRFGSADFQDTRWVTPQIDGGSLGADGPICQPGDVNGDGRADLVCLFKEKVLGGRQFLGTALSVGNGTFNLDLAPTLIVDDQREIPEGSHINIKDPYLTFSTRSMALGDINADGMADVEILDLRPADVDVCPVSNTTTCVIHIDLHNAISKGDGTYNLGEPVLTDWTHEVGNFRETVQATDLDGDGQSDYLILTATLSERRDVVLRSMKTALRSQSGSYTFKDQTPPAALGDRPVKFTLGDTNGDGLADILAVAPVTPSTTVTPSTSSSCSNAIAVKHPILARILSKGDGTFALPTGWDDCPFMEEVARPWPTIRVSSDLRSADTNGDGIADFLIGIDDFVSTDKANFSAYDSVSRAAGLDTHHWQSADITGDGRDDLVYISSQATGAFIHSLLKQPDGTMRQVAQPVPIWENASLRSWKILDVNGDGRADLVHLQCFDPFIFPLCKLDLDTFLSNGDGSFARQPSTSIFMGFGMRAGVSDWHTMDVNGDGKMDLVCLAYLRASSTANEGLYIETLTSNSDGTWSSLPVKGPFRPSLRPLDPSSGPFAEDTQSWRPMDVNGDGKTDLVRVRSSRSAIEVSTLWAVGNGDWRYQSYPYTAQPADQWNDISSAENILAWHSADVNGDGVADLVHLARVPGSLRIHTLFSNGDGRWTLSQQQPPFVSALGPNALTDVVNWRAIDTNGDRRTDLVHTLRTSAGMQIGTLLSTGTGGWTVQSEIVNDPGGFGNRSAPIWQPGDVDGDGVWDLVRVDISHADPPHLFVSALLSRTPLDMLVRQSRGGGTTLVEYTPSSRYAVSDPTHGCSLPSGAVMQLVASTTISDGRGLNDKASYAYTCARWSYAQRMFLGWTDVTTFGSSAPNHPASTLVMRYQHTDQCFTQAIDTHSRDQQGRFVAGRDIVAYYSPGAAPPYNCQVLYRNHLEYNTASSVAQNAYTEFAYDAFGNVIDIFEYGLPNHNGDERTTTIAYNPAPGPYLVGLPWQVTVSEGVHPARKADRITYYCYDKENGTDSSICPSKPTKGLLTMTQAVDNKGLYVNSTYVYDAYGNLLNKIDARHNGMITFYDKTFHLYPETICNALMQCTSLEWDTVLGQITKSTDLNHKSTQFKYDALGRPIVTTYPNGLMEHQEYLDWGDANRQRICKWVEEGSTKGLAADPNRQQPCEWLGDGSSEGLWAKTYLDGLGRPYRIARKGDAPGRTFVQGMIYSDASSQPFRQSHWYTSPHANPVYEEFEYDGVGRPTKQTHPDSTSLRWSYGSDDSRTWVTSYDELGHEHTVYRDAYGRMSQIREKNDGVYSSMTYTYDAVDEVLSVTDDKGNVTTNIWDILGHKRMTSDPDRGMWSYTYDLVGNLHTQTDAKGATLTFTYDPLDRLETKQYPNGTKTVWHYDEPGHGASRGRLASVSDLSGASCPKQLSEEYSYNEMGQVTSQMKCVEGRAYTMTFGYKDPLGRLKSIIYPDSEEVTYTYDVAGRLGSMPGYIDQLQYDAAGRLTAAKYSNHTEENFAYDPKRAWLNEATVSHDNSKLYQISYHYYSNGLVQSSSSSTNDMNLSYIYDDLNRLKTVSGDLQESYTYDSLGNMKSNSNVGSYTYLPSGPSGCTTDATKPIPCKGPHAVEHAGTRSYKYDNNGNMKSVFDSSSGAEKGIDWNVDNQPESISDFSGSVTQMLYDAWGNRVRRARGSETISYFGSLLEYSSLWRLTKYYYAGPLLIARKDETGTYWYHQDHLGSTRLITDQKGAVAARYNYKSFGEKTHSSGQTTNTIQFTGQRTDEENGLIYMNSRYYDPQLARFISADGMVPDGQNSQAFNRYSYVYNNPISNVDPTGHDPQDWSEVDPLLLEEGGLAGGISYQIGVPYEWAETIEATDYYRALTTQPEYVEPGFTFGDVAPGPPLIPQLIGGFAETVVGGLKLGIGAAQASLAESWEEKVVPILQDIVRFSQGFNLLAGAAVSAGAGGAPEQSLEKVAAELRARAKQIHSELDSKAAQLRTTAVFRGRTPSGETVDVVGVGAQQDLSPAQRAILRLGEVEARLPGADAEMTVLHYMQQNKITPIAGGIYGGPIRPFCSTCRFTMGLEEVGGVFISPQEVIFPFSWGP